MSGRRVESEPMKRGPRFAGLLAGVLAALAAAAGVDEPAAIGRAYFELDGAPGILGAAQPVEDGAIVRALSAAIVHLDNGEVLRLAANSAAIFRAESDGRVAVTVLSGKLSKSHDGEILHAGAGAAFTLEPSFVDPLEAESRLLEVSRPDRPSGRADSPRERGRASPR